MVEKTGESEFKGEVPEHLKQLLQMRNSAIARLFDVKENREKGIYTQGPAGEDKALADLKKNLNLLLMNYWPKKDYKEDFDLDEDLERKITSAGPEPSADDLNFDECRQLLYEIIELMEQLGHTKFETDKTGRRTI